MGQQTAAQVMWPVEKGASSIAASPSARSPFDFSGCPFHSHAMTPQERRTSPRLQVWIPALVTILAPDRPELIRQRPAVIVDLSERGALIAMHLEKQFSTAVIQRNRLCRLSVAASTGLPSEILCRAVWIEPPPPGDEEMKIGLFFENCPREITAGLRAFLSRIEPPEKGLEDLNS